MKRIIKGALGMTATAALATFGLTATATQARADSCEADSGYSCVQVRNWNRAAFRSIRVNDTCVWGIENSWETRYPSITVEDGTTPTTLTYSGSRCEASTQNTANVSWDDQSHADRFREVSLREKQDDDRHHGGCALGTAMAIRPIC